MQVFKLGNETAFFSFYQTETGFQLALEPLGKHMIGSYRLL